jgi:hypothetical protein
LAGRFSRSPMHISKVKNKEFTYAHQQSKEQRKRGKKSRKAEDWEAENEPETHRSDSNLAVAWGRGWGGMQHQTRASLGRPDSRTVWWQACLVSKPSRSIVAPVNRASPRWGRSYHHRIEHLTTSNAPEDVGEGGNARRRQRLVYRKSRR